MTRSKPTGELVSTMDLNGRKRRYENPSQIKSYWLGTMGLSKKQQFAVSHRKKAILAADESHKAVEASILTPEPLEVPKVASHEGIPHKLRKSAISFFYKLYFRLTTSIEAAVTSIMTLCRIPRGSRDSVRNIIKELRVQEEEPSQPANKSRPWQQLIKDDSVESVLVCTLVQRGALQFKEAQEYLEKTYPGMVARQLRCCLDEMAPLYRGKCVGDSPELCRILDAHGFSDLEKSISHHVAISSFLPFDDDRRFNMGTPKEVMRTMARCWEVAPTSSQIIVYAEKYKEILEKIVAAEGTMVPGTALRSGRRALNHKGDGEIITRLRQSNRKALLRGRILHKDVAWLRDNMLRSADGTVSTEQNIEGIDEIIDRLVDAEEQLEQHMEHADIEREAGDALLMLAAGDSDDDYENGDEEYAYHVLHDTMSGL